MKERERERKREREKRRGREAGPALSRSAIEKENNENGAPSSTLIFPLVCPILALLNGLPPRRHRLRRGDARRGRSSRHIPNERRGMEVSPCAGARGRERDGIRRRRGREPRGSEPRQRRLAGQKRERRLPTAVVPARLRAVPRGPEDEACIPEISRDGVELGRGAAARRRKWKRRKRRKGKRRRRPRSRGASTAAKRRSRRRRRRR